MKKKLFGFILGSMLVLTPALSLGVAYAADNNPIVPDCGKSTPLLDGTGKDTGETEVKNPCNFDNLMELINNIINFLLFVIATPLIAIILCYVGFLMITSGGSSEKLTKAKHILRNAIFGYLIALAAWLVVKTILTTLGFNGPMYLKNHN